MFRIFFIASFLSLSLFANEPTAHEEESTQKFWSLDWKHDGNHKLPFSNSTISLPKDHHLVIGEDARVLDAMNGNFRNECIEAVTFNDTYNSMVIFLSINEGYVSLNDWNKINAETMLKEISERTEEENKERKIQKLEEIHVIDWLQKPLLNTKKNTVSWAIEAEREGGERFVNSVAIKLGRLGYEKLIWVTDKSQYIPENGELDLLMNAHKFDRGFRYKDFTKGDKVAKYGIASLVAATVGAKILKATGLIILIKKIGAVVIAFFAALFYKIRKLFKKKHDSEPPDLFEKEKEA